MTYISYDVETDGPIPGKHSMLSLGAVAFDEQGKELGSFQENFKHLTGAIEDPDTMEWWSRNQEAYEEATKDTVLCEAGMLRFKIWLQQFPKPWVGVAYPSGFDHTFLYWYSHMFLGYAVLGMSTLDIKSYATAVLKIPFKKTVKKNMPKEWFIGCGKHTHRAVDDAREQGELFLNMLRANQDDIEN